MKSTPDIDRVDVNSSPSCTIYPVLPLAAWPTLCGLGTTWDKAASLWEYYVRIQ